MLFIVLVTYKVLYYINKQYFWKSIGDRISYMRSGGKWFGRLQDYTKETTSPTTMDDFHVSRWWDFYVFDSNVICIIKQISNETDTDDEWMI